MNPVKLIISFCLFTFISLNSYGTTHVYDVNEDIASRGEELINKFMEGLRVRDFERSIKEVLPYLHKSMKSKYGDDITRDLRLYGFKKAHRGALRYQFPVKLTLIRKVIYRRDLGEKGQEYDFFIKKTSDYNGYPAPVKVFHHEASDKLTISYIGSI